MPERKPWERQKGETRKAYEAFVIYRDLGGTRTLQQVAKKLTKSETLIRGWSAKWDWLNRVAAYEESVRAEAEHRTFERRIDEQLSEADEREKQRKTRLGGARILRTVATAAAVELGKALEAGEHKQTITCPKCGEVMGMERITKLIGLARNVAGMFDKGAMHERLEEQRPTAIVETRLTPVQERKIAEIIRDVVPQDLWEDTARRMDEAFSSNGKVEYGDSN